MVNVKTSSNMFKMQISAQGDNVRKNFAAERKYILRKMRLKFRESRFSRLQDYSYKM